MAFTSPLVPPPKLKPRPPGDGAVKFPPHHNSASAHGREAIAANKTKRRLSAEAGLQLPIGEARINDITEQAKAFIHIIVSPQDLWPQTKFNFKILALQ